jgi:hypothetical protein
MLWLVFVTSQTLLFKLALAILCQEPENSGGILCGKSLTTTMKVNKAKNVFLNKGGLIREVLFLFSPIVRNN